MNTLFKPIRYTTRAISGAVLLAPIAMLAATAAVAQDATLALEEVVVTAQKRAENIQDVPLAITALSAAALEEKGVTNVADVSNFTPNIQIDRSSPFAGSSTIMSAYIRGIGQNDFAFNMEPGVGLYVDGVYYARTVGAAIDLLDVERVEVLKGPQGTLFGRNTIGGALAVVTRKPGKEFGFQGDVAMGNYNSQKIRGTINLPLVDGLLYSSFAFSSTQRDGYQKRIAFDPASTTVVNPMTGAPYTGTTTTAEQENPLFVRAKSNFSGSDTQGGQNSRGVRAKFLFTPTDDVEFLLAADLTNSHEESQPNTVLRTYTGGLFNALYNGCIGGIPLDMTSSPSPPIAACDVPRATVGTSLNDIAATAIPYGNHFITGDRDTTYATGSNFSDVRTYGFSGTLDWRFSDALSMKSITAYRNLDSKFGTDLDGSPIAYLDLSFTMVQNQWSEELQFNINAFDNKLKSVVGAYYFKEQGNLLDTVIFGDGLLQVVGPNDFDNKAVALFTHNNYAINDQFGLTFGIRRTKETKDFSGGQSDLNALANRTLGVPNIFYPDPSNTQLLFPTEHNQVTFNNTSVRVGGEYKITPDVMTYLSYAQGYKSGGWTTRLGAPLQLSVILGAPIDPTKAPSFEPEKANTYEAGIKASLMNNRLRLNTALFRTDYKDMQVVAITSFAAGVPWFFNAGEARIQGVEIESDFKATSFLTLNASVGYLDAKYRSLSAFALADPNMKLSNMLVNVPKYSGNVGANFNFDVAADRELNLHADYIYKSKMARNATNTPELIQPAFYLVNASLGYGPSNHLWQLFLSADNLTNQRYIVSGNDNDGLGVTSGSYNAPRMWTLGVKIRSN